jgi:hypothetical protein
LKKKLSLLLKDKKGSESLTARHVKKKGCRQAEQIQKKRKEEALLREVEGTTYEVRDF